MSCEAAGWHPPDAFMSALNCKVSRILPTTAKHALHDLFALLVVQAAGLACMQVCMLCSSSSGQPTLPPMLMAPAAHLPLLMAPAVRLLLTAPEPEAAPAVADNAMGVGSGEAPDQVHSGTAATFVERQMLPSEGAAIQQHHDITQQLESPGVP